MGTLFLSQGKYKELGFPLALQINSVVVGQGANTNNRSSVTHVLFRKGERLLRRRSGKCPGCWMRAREKKSVTILIPPTVAQRIVNETALLTSACYSRGTDREQKAGQRASHIGQDKGLFS